MVIYKVRSTENKGYQQLEIVYDCKNHFYDIKISAYSDYYQVMNMETYRFNDEHNCYITSYYFNPNKW